jgi:hypothetical protein
MRGRPVFYANFSDLCYCVLGLMKLADAEFRVFLYERGHDLVDEQPELAI